MMESDFIDEEQIPLLQREDNYDDDVYDDNIANETSFTEHDDTIKTKLRKQNSACVKNISMKKKNESMP